MASLPYIRSIVWNKVNLVIYWQGKQCVHLQVIVICNWLQTRQFSPQSIYLDCRFCLSFVLLPCNVSPRAYDVLHKSVYRESPAKSWGLIAAHWINIVGLLRVLSWPRTAQNTISIRGNQRQKITLAFDIGAKITRKRQGCMVEEICCVVITRHLWTERSLQDNSDAIKNVGENRWVHFWHFYPTKQWQEENIFLMSFGMLKKREIGEENKRRE